MSEIQSAGARTVSALHARFATLRPRRRAAPGLLGGAVALLSGVVGVVLLASPDPAPSSTASSWPSASASLMPQGPSATPMPTVSESSSVSPPPSGAPAGDRAIEPGDYAVVPQGELAIYDAPDGTPFTAALPGSDVYVIDVRGRWAEVQAQLQVSYGYVFGWVPRETLDRRSPTTCLEVRQGAPVWFGNVAHPQRDFECLGSSSRIVARGYAIDRSEDPPGPYRGDPAWLAGQPTLELAAAIGPAVTTTFSFLYLPPDLEGTIPTSDRDGLDGTLLEVTGHFDDSRAGGCRLDPSVAGAEVRPALAELWCRQRFVVDRVEVVSEE